MAAFPDIVSVIPSIIPYDYSQLYKNISTTDFSNGEELRRIGTIAPTRNITLQYAGLNSEQNNELINFYTLMHGGFEAFSFFFPHDSEYTNEYAGVVTDIVMYSFTLPSQGLLTGVLKRNGIVMSGYSITTGSDGSTKCYYSAGIKKGDLITWSFTGRLKIRAVFVEDTYPVQEIKDTFFSTSFKLKGLQHKL